MPPIEQQEKRIFISFSAQGEDVAELVEEVIIKENKSEPEIQLIPVLCNSGYYKNSSELINSLHSYDYGIFIFTPDQIPKVKRSREKVYFEYGLFIAKSDGEKKAFAIEPDNSNLPLSSNLDGIVTLTYRHTPERERLLPEIKIVVGIIFRKIRDYEKEKKQTDEVALNEKLKDIDEKLLNAPNDEAKLRVIVTSLESIAKLKRDVTHQSITDVLEDIITWIRIETLNPMELSDLQAKALSVWIYSNDIIEFDIKFGELQKKYINMVEGNLQKNIHYSYFIDSENYIPAIEKLATKYNGKIKLHKISYPCILSNYIIHFYKDDTFDVFQNIKTHGKLNSVKLDTIEAEVIINKIKSITNT